MAKRSLPKHGLRSYSDDPVDLPPDDETLVLRRAIDEPLYQPDEPASASDYVPTRAGGNRGIPASPERFMDESVDAELPDWDTLRSFATPLGGRFADVATPEPAAKHAADGPDKERGILRRHRGRRERDAGEQLKPAKPGRALTDDPGAVSASATVSAPDWDQVSAPTPTRMQSTESTPFTASAGYTQTPETTQRPATSETHAFAATPETDHTQSPVHTPSWDTDRFQSPIRAQSAAPSLAPTSPVDSTTSAVESPAPTAAEPQHTTEPGTRVELNFDRPNFTPYTETHEADAADAAPRPGVDYDTESTTILPRTTVRRARRSHFPWRRVGLFAGVGVAVAAIAISLGVFFGSQHTNPAVSPTPIQAVEPLLSLDDVGSLASVQWQADGSPDASELFCVGPLLAQTQLPDEMGSAKFTSESGYLLDYAAGYADADRANAAYNALINQLGSCQTQGTQLLASQNIKNLADAAYLVQLKVPDEVPYQTILFAQSGRRVYIFDLADAQSSVSAQDFAVPVIRLLTRLCRDSNGSCPSALSYSDAVPPAGTFPGFLNDADIPLVRDTGQWAGEQPGPVKESFGTKCESSLTEKLKTAPQQRTFTVTGDDAMPTMFGVDQADYTFDSAAEAKEFAGKITTELNGCQANFPTVQVTQDSPISGTGTLGQEFTAELFAVTQRAEGGSSYYYRTALITAGKRVSYVVVPHTTDYDFTETQWRELVMRAGQRLTQS